jgi:glycerol-3-phosphate cytidylyltransferase
MITGIIAGSFDIIHQGYILMFKEAKINCDNLTVALHSDPTIERPFKIKPILSLQDRIEILKSIRYIDNVVTYDTELDLINLLKNRWDIRFLGDDYKEKNYTGKDLPINIYFINRDHGWSTTKFKNLIKNL